MLHVGCFVRKMLPNPMRSSQAAAPDLNNMPDECRLKISDRMRNKMPERCQINCQKICEMICQDISGFFKKTNHPVTLIAKKLACPLSPNSMLLHRFAWKGLQKKQPFRFGCRHALGNNIDQGGAAGSV